MRTAFFSELSNLAAADPRVTLVVGDLGFSVVEEFASRFPKQYVNAGVAEQNMTGFAAGLAMTGRHVFTYSIANFPTLRCLEQIRNDVCYHSLSVTVVAVGGGLAYGALGASHHATEDLAIMRALPNMTVIAPGDPLESRLATRALVARGGPSYLRLGKAGEPTVHLSPPDFAIGTAVRVRDGRDVTLVSTGGMLSMAVEAADQLAEAGVSTRVLSMHTVSPLDADAIVSAARDTRLIVSVEEHSVLGGLGGAVAEIVAGRRDRSCRLVRFGLENGFVRTVGSQAYLRQQLGLTSERLCQVVRDSL